MIRIKKLTFVMLFSLVGMVAMEAQSSKFTLTTNRSIGQLLAFTVNYGAAVSVDWGDGNAVQYTSLGDSITGILKGATVTVEAMDVVTLDCSGQGLTALNISDVTDLQGLACHDNELAALDVTKNTKLVRLNCAFNKLQALSLTGTPLLTDLIVNNNQITSLGLTSSIKSIKTLICNDNKISTLNLAYLAGLKNLWCQNNVLTALNASQCVGLETLICYNNQISTLNLTGLTVLNNLWCDANRISELNLSSNVALAYVSANNSSITKLTVGTPFNVKSLYLNDNSLGYKGLPSITGISNYKYAPQGAISIPLSIDTNTALDLSAQLTTANNVATNASYNWKNGQATLTAGEDYVENNGVFTFKKAFPSVFCEISSTIFPELPVISTTAIAVNLSSAVDETLSDPALSLFANNGKLIVKSSQLRDVKVYSITGVLVKSVDKLLGTLEIALPKGVYIVNKHKIAL